MTHTISHYIYTIEFWYGNNDEPDEIYTFSKLHRVKNLIDMLFVPTGEHSLTVCLSMTEVYYCGYEVPIDKAAWSDKDDFTNIYNFIKEQEIRDTWIEIHLKGVQND